MKIFAHLDLYLSWVSGAQISMGQIEFGSASHGSFERKTRPRKNRPNKEEAFQLIKCIGQLNKAVSAFP